MNKNNMEKILNNYKKVYEIIKRTDKYNIRELLEDPKLAEEYELSKKDIDTLQWFLEYEKL